MLFDRNIYIIFYVSAPIINRAKLNVSVKNINMASLIGGIIGGVIGSYASDTFGFLSGRRDQSVSWNLNPTVQKYFACVPIATDTSAQSFLARYQRIIDRWFAQREPLFRANNIEYIPRDWQIFTQNKVARDVISMRAFVLKHSALPNIIRAPELISGPNVTVLWIPFSYDSDDLAIYWVSFALIIALNDVDMRAYVRANDNITGHILVSKNDSFENMQITSPRATYSENIAATLAQIKYRAPREESFAKSYIALHVLN